MGLFNRKKKSCCNIDVNNISEIENGSILILGTGCNRCFQLERNTKIALNEMNMDENINHISDIGKIASYGVMSTPALVLNDKVVSIGKVLNVEEIKTLIISNL